MVRPYFFYTLMAVLCLSALPCLAQNSVSEQAKPSLTLSLIFERYTSQNGLPDNRIRAIHQDKKGFLWIGTMNGLSRYDGYAFKNYYKKGDNNGMTGNWSPAIVEDKNDDLWIGTIDGLTHFDVKKQVFTHYKYDANNPNSLPTNHITGLLFDDNGTLWIGTTKGLAAFNPTTKTFKRQLQASLNTIIGGLTKSYDNCIWVATYDGIVRLNVQTEAAQLYPLSIQPNAYGIRFVVLLEKDKNLYIGTGNSGLFHLQFDALANGYTHFNTLNSFQNSPETLDKTEVFDLCLAPNGDLWAGTDKGLARIQQTMTGPTLRFYRHNPLNARSLSNNRVYKIFIDKTNVLWCGTEQALNKLDLNTLAFQYHAFVNLSANDFVRSLATFDGATVWFGTAQSGFYKYDARQSTSTAFSNQNSPFFNAHRVMDVDSATQQLWVGSLGGLLQMSKNAPPQYKTVLAGRAVFATHRDRAGNRWIGTAHGLFKLGNNDKISGGVANKISDKMTDNASPQLVILGDLDASTFVRSIYEDSAGRLWVGTDTDGVGFIDTDGQYKRLVQQHDVLLGNMIYAIAEFPKNTVWLGTELGLNKVEMSANSAYTIQHFGTEKGLPAQSVNGILIDNQGDLWLSSIKGLARFNVKTKVFQYYLPQLSFNHSCAFRLNDHTFLFGANDGYVQFDPSVISSNNEAPSVAFSNFKVFNEELTVGKTYNGDVILSQNIPQTQAVELNYLNNSFTIEFAALHFADPQQNRYAYQLEGYDKDWIETNSSNRSATYTNLDAGTYTFKVKASNHTGQWSDKPITLTINVLSPPWKTGWAIAFYFLLFNLLLYIFIRYLWRFGQQRQQIQFEQKEKAQLRAINDLKQGFFTDISHEFRTPLSLIVGPVNELMRSSEVVGEARKKLKLIQRNSQKLLHLIDELMTFQKLEQGVLKMTPYPIDIVAFVREVFNNFEPLATQKNIDFKCLCTEKELWLQADGDKLEKVFNNLIINALRFTSKGGTVAISLEKRQNIDVSSPNTEGVIISVTDNGTGIKAADMPHLFTRFFQSKDNPIGGTGIGLSLAKSLVELHKGTISVESEPNVRTCFSVYLPIQAVNSVDITSGFEEKTSKNAQNTEGVADVKFGLSAVLDNSKPFVIQKEQNSKLEEVNWHKHKMDLPNLLIVEDNAEMQDFLLTLFKGDYHVHAADNGREALDFIKKIEPDVILSDVMMPEMNGIELCKRLKTNVNTCHIPLILLTAKTTIENTLEGLHTGADDYIPKPFHPDLLRIKIQNLIESRRLLREKYGNGQRIVPKDVTMHPLDAEFLQKTLDTIHANLGNDDFSVEALGKAVNMSRSNLFRKIKALTGQTAIEFINHIRLQYAADLLIKRKMSIADIAYHVGFQTPQAFSKAFKKQFNKTPTAYLDNYLHEVF
jgi:signal transduction histidine kinase/ligand-binding sensor domain-containing protein/DNA-binding response OmpR family regulator